MNFRFARRVEVVDGYPQTVAWARFRENDLSIGGDVGAPTQGDQDAILAEVRAAPFPKLASLAALADLPPGVHLPHPDIHVCHDFDGRIVMLHQRFETEAGKGFVPWTRWSDGQWRKMEPEVMPFFGLPGSEKASTLFLHEGAKAADRVRRIVASEIEGSRFPWFDSLRWGHHVGWLGGVHSVERSDWGSLAKLSWKRVIIVADNDAPGWRVVGRIARHFCCPTKVIWFGRDWPEAFDLGDEFPAAMFDESGRYIGPSFADCLQPADWATDLVEVPRENGRGTKREPVLRTNFVEQNFVVTDIQQVFQRDRPARARTKEQFNDDCRWRSDAKDTYSELIRHGEAICARRVYVPAAPPGPIVHDGELCWNGYEPPNIVPVAGDPQPFLDFVAHLAPMESDRRALLRWLATVIAKPEVRVRYSVLLISKTQGVGKTTLGTILKRLLGASNVSFPNERTIADSQFNGWALGKRVIVVNEIYSNGRSTVYDKLKPYVTDEDIEINEKHVKAFTIQNCAVILACSNSEKALFIPDEDRRWLIPTVTSELKPREWWDALYAWLDAEGAGIILNWAREFTQTDWVRTGERAPDSSAKAAIIAASKSEGRLMARDFAEEFVNHAERVVVRVSDLQRWIAGKRNMTLDNPRLEKERTIIDEVEGVGGIHVLKGDRRPKIGGRTGAKASVILNYDPGSDASWTSLEPHFRTLEEIGYGDEF